MSTDSGQPEAGLCGSDRGRLRHDDVQPGTPGGGSPEASPGGVDDWSVAFKVLSGAISRQFVSGDLLYLLALTLKREVGIEAARVFADHADLNRDRQVHTFMG